MATKKFVKVTIDLDKQTLWWLFNEAHKRDITLNQLVNDILKKYMGFNSHRVTGDKKNIYQVHRKESE